MENRKNYKQQRQKLLRLRNNCNQAVFFGIPAQGMEIFSLTKHIFWMDLDNCNFGSTDVVFHRSLVWYFRVYDFNCRWRVRLYFFSSFTMALGQPIRVVNVSRR